jgi:8-oxo-dGTP pyrophosphatase MutT (NUDIX family)
MSVEPDSPAVVAAVCYRRVGDAPEFLLVRTKGGRRWTFPKGHVKRGESAPGAAAREACEEAGVHGVIAAHAFTRYRYPSGSDGEGERWVSAYLLEVGTQRAPRRGEKHRDPTWFDPGSAERALGEGGREPEYRREHARILKEALAELEGRTAA